MDRINFSNGVFWNYHNYQASRQVQQHLKGGEWCWMVFQVLSFWKTDCTHLELLYVPAHHSPQYLLQLFDQIAGFYSEQDQQSGILVTCCSFIVPTNLNLNTTKMGTPKLKWQDYFHWYFWGRLSWWCSWGQVWWCWDCFQSYFWRPCQHVMFIGMSFSTWDGFQIILLKTTLFMMLMKMSLVEEDVSSQAG